MNLALSSLAIAVEYWKGECRIASERPADVIWVVFFRAHVILESTTNAFSTYDGARGKVLELLADHEIPLLRRNGRVREEYLSHIERIKRQVQMLPNGREWQHIGFTDGIDLGCDITMHQCVVQNAVIE